jgi:hypothetical protein
MTYNPYIAGAKQKHEYSSENILHGPSKRKQADEWLRPNNSYDMNCILYFTVYY